MRYSEFAPNQQLNEGGDATSKRFFSELGALAAWAGYERTPSFDPNKPEEWLDPDKILNPDSVFSDVKRFLTDANNAEKTSKEKNKFGIMGYYELSKRSRRLIIEDMAKKSIDPPTMFDWVGGVNASSVGATPSDVNFVDHPIAGVSIKDDGGTGVANLGAGELEFEGKGDLFARLAPEEICALKQEIMKDLIHHVRTQGYYESRGKPYYNMTWHENNGKIQIDAKGKKIAGTPEQLMDWGFLIHSNDYQRCLGDYFLHHGSKYKKFSDILLHTVSDKIKDAIEKKILPNAKKLAKLGGFGSQPYYYQLAAPFKVAYVPDLDTANDIEILNITSPNKFSGGLKFKIALRRRDPNNTDGPNATVEVHIRYAQGIFGSSPSFRIQSLKGHENLYWEILTSK